MKLSWRSLFTCGTLRPGYDVFSWWNVICYCINCFSNKCSVDRVLHMCTTHSFGPTLQSMRLKLTGTCLSWEQELGTFLFFIGKRLLVICRREFLRYYNMLLHIRGHNLQPLSLFRYHLIGIGSFYWCFSSSLSFMAIFACSVLNEFESNFLSTVDFLCIGHHIFAQDTCFSV